MLQIGGLVAVVFVSSLTPPPPPKTTALQNLIAQPHRLFFFTGVVQGLLFISILILNYTGIIALQVGTGIYHGYAFIFVVFTQFFAGFLLTTFPRYLARPSPKKEAYIPVAIWINGGALLLIAFSFVSQLFATFAMIVIGIGYVKFCQILLEIQTNSTIPKTNKKDTTWMLRAFALGGVSHLLFILDTFIPTYALAFSIGFYLYLFMIIIVVSQKMIPFFTANSIVGYQITKSRYFIPLLFAALIAKVGLEFLALNAFLANGALTLILIYELLKWNLPYTKVPAILGVLFVSLWWAPIGFALFFIQDISLLLGIPILMEKAPLHAIALGYFTTILVGFGTRIVLGHSGRTPKADAYAQILFGLIQVMTFMRVFAGIFPQYGYFHAILTAAGLWIVIFGLWSKRYLSILFEK